MTEKAPVLIVGAGPVGLILAGDLGWGGIRCTLIEKSDGIIPSLVWTWLESEALNSAGAGASFRG